MTPKEIQRLMDKNKWSKTQLAVEIGVTENAVRKWLSGDRSPSGSAEIILQMLAKGAKT